MDGILRCIKKLSEYRTDFVFTIAGDGDLEKEKEKIKMLNIPKEVLRFQGEMSEKEVTAIFNRHDVFVLFSNYENLPCVLVEAQVGGLAIIATDVGGVSEIVSSEKYGVLISSKNEQQLLESLDKMIDKIDQYDSDQISEMAMAKYSEVAVATAMIEVYKKVLGNNYSF